MTHALPLGRSRNNQLLADINQELHSIISDFKCKPVYKTLEGILHNGAKLRHDDPALLYNLIKGYEPLLDANPNLLMRLINVQSQKNPNE